MNRSNTLRFIVSLFACLASVAGTSFELVTHGAITNQAYNVSALGKSPILLGQHLGWVKPIKEVEPR